VFNMWSESILKVIKPWTSPTDTQFFI
jgi:hypothetical protein